ncbi:hypothetical protein L1987_17927 [Smallanthus sonchifolius]|uniref:Uncharacterized protein n=1 Tax=Smallanthus sonchifolius TaxID=185202 RepID=A0ACB9IYV0_9ASTR|nr:hypothetical protein L1987_17927 [Smallanthus sonchifolius]
MLQQAVQAYNGLARLYGSLFIVVISLSHLILLPPVVYVSLPSWFKVTFLFELPIYNRNLPKDEAALGCMIAYCTKRHTQDLEQTASTTAPTGTTGSSSTVKNTLFESSGDVISETKRARYPD